MSTRNLTLDLHAIYNRGTLIEAALDGIVRESEEKRAVRVEIICGKGSGQLKKRVLRFLGQKDVRVKYHRVKKDVDNFGRVFVYFRWR